MSKVGRGADQIMLRVPDGMRDQIKALTQQTGRSMTSEIIVAIEKHLAASGVELPSEPKPYNARLDTFVAAALTGLVDPSHVHTKVGERNSKIIIDGWCVKARQIGQQMLALMEARDEPR